MRGGAGWEEGLGGRRQGQGGEDPGGVETSTAGQGQREQGSGLAHRCFMGVCLLYTVTHWEAGKPSRIFFRLAPSTTSALSSSSCARPRFWPTCTAAGRGGQEGGREEAGSVSLRARLGQVRRRLAGQPRRSQHAWRCGAAQLAQLLQLPPPRPLPPLTLTAFSTCSGRAGAEAPSSGSNSAM